MPGLTAREHGFAVPPVSKICRELKIRDMTNNDSQVGKDSKW